MLLDLIGLARRLEIVGELMGEAMLDIDPPRVLRIPVGVVQPPAEVMLEPYLDAREGNEGARRCDCCVLDEATFVLAVFADASWRDRHSPSSDPLAGGCMIT